MNGQRTVITWRRIWVTTITTILWTVSRRRWRHHRNKRNIRRASLPSHTTKHQTDEKAELPQRWPRDAPYIWVTWKFSTVP